jgi:hypothetical protein
MPTIAEFTSALSKLPPPSKKMKALLAAHVAAPKYAMTAELLAAEAGYRDFRGFNAAYGHLAKKLCRALRCPTARIGLIVDFVPPGKLTNRHWLAFLNASFAKALRRAGWIT